MARPIEEMLDHAAFLARHLNNCDLQFQALVILLDMGVPTDCDGFQYLKNAIVCYYRTPRKLITKEIYLEVGRLYDPAAGGKQVENAIRRAIVVAWTERDDDIWASYFPRRNGSVRKPSNREFISQVACFMELWQGCCKEGCL